MAEPVLPADEVAEIRKWTVWNGYVDAGRLADSHEALRATVARLRTAAGDLLDQQTTPIGQCRSCLRLTSLHRPNCPAVALRAALDDTAEPFQRVGCVAPDGQIMRGHFGPCAEAGHRPVFATSTTAGAPEPTREPLWEGPLDALWRSFPDGLGHPPGTVVQVFAAAPPMAAGEAGPQATPGQDEQTIERCTSRSPQGDPCVLVAGHGIRHAGPKRIVGRATHRRRWGPGVETAGDLDDALVVAVPTDHEDPTNG